MKVPENYEDCRVVYYIPLQEPYPGGPDEPDTIAYALIECPLPAGTYSKKGRKGKPPPTQLFSIQIDTKGQPIWESDYWHGNEEEFLEYLARWGSGLPLLKPGDDIPDSQGL
jgi:hypothetical protein